MVSHKFHVYFDIVFQYSGNFLLEDFKPRLREQLQCNCQKLLRCHRREIIATWLHGALEKFAVEEKFPEDVVLPAHDMLHRNLYML